MVIGFIYFFRHLILLTVCPLEKMVSILQTVSSAFSSVKVFIFWLKFHWSLFRTVANLMSVCIGSGSGHYLNQCWPSSLTHFCATRRQWFNRLLKILDKGRQTSLSSSGVDSYTPRTTKLLGGILVSLRPSVRLSVCPSVRPSVRPACRVRSVSSTVMDGFFSY